MVRAHRQIDLLPGADHSFRRELAAISARYIKRSCRTARSHSHFPESTATPDSLASYVDKAYPFGIYIDFCFCFGSGLEHVEYVVNHFLLCFLHHIAVLFYL